MSISGKCAAVVMVSAAALIGSGAGTAHAAGDLYGSIAVGGYRVGEAFDYPTQYGADQAALEACNRENPTGSCRIETRIHNECGVVLERDAEAFFASSPWYISGNGPTPAAAEENARFKFGMDNYQTFNHMFGSVKPAVIVDAICTSNAG